MKSAIYTGTVRHRRFEPRERSFAHGVTYFYLDLDEIPRLFRFPLLFAYDRPALFSFARKHFIGGRDAPARSIAETVRERVREKHGFTPEGPIRLLGQISYFGFCFNPVVFYYCFDRTGEDLEAIVAEITNTPWNETHAYVLRCAPGSNGRQKFEFEKTFHVSPFLSMDYGYEWAFTEPGKTLVVHMENHPNARNPGAKFVHFDATLTLHRREWGFRSVAGSIVRQPFMTLKTLALIYIHAGILWIRRFTFFSHPKLASQEKKP